MTIETHNLWKEDGKLCMVATIVYPAGVHIGSTRNDTLEEQNQKQAQYIELLTAHNVEHDEIRGLYLGAAQLTQEGEEK